MYFYPGCERQSPDIVHQIMKLRDCITVLFNFHRQPTEDGEFLKNLESWTERLVFPLYNILTYYCHFNSLPAIHDNCCLLSHLLMYFANNMVPEQRSGLMVFAQWVKVF